MKVRGKHYRSIWVKKGKTPIIQAVDQRYLPHRFVIEDLKTVKAVYTAIKDMHVRGAPLIGAAAAYGVYLAVRESQRARNFNDALVKASALLESARPTAVNLEWAVRKQLKALKAGKTPEEKAKIAFQTANQIADDDVRTCQKIGHYGSLLIQEIAKLKRGDRKSVV